MARFWMVEATDRIGRLAYGEKHETRESALVEARERMDRTKIVSASVLECEAVEEVANEPEAKARELIDRGWAPLDAARHVARELGLSFEEYDQLKKDLKIPPGRG